MTPIVSPLEPDDDPRDGLFDPFAAFLFPPPAPAVLASVERLREFAHSDVTGDPYRHLLLEHALGHLNIMPQYLSAVVVFGLEQSLTDLSPHEPGTANGADGLPPSSDGDQDVNQEQ